MALLKEAVNAGVHVKESFEFFPAVAESKGVITDDKAGRCPIKVLYSPFHELTLFTVFSDSMSVLPSEDIV